MTARALGNIYYGTCSWADRTLIDSGFYPPQAQTAAARLAYYASRFPLVEVDSTYYAPPSEANAHEAPWAQHEAALRPLVEAASSGPCCSSSLRGSARTGAIATTCARSPRAPWRVGVKFRCGWWMADEHHTRSILRLLEELGLGHVVVDEPQGFKSSTPPAVAATAPLAVFRFHGRNAATWEARGITPAGRFRYLYGEEELKEWVPTGRRRRAAPRIVQQLLPRLCRRNALHTAGLLGESRCRPRSPDGA